MATATATKSGTKALKVRSATALEGQIRRAIRNGVDAPASAYTLLIAGSAGIGKTAVVKGLCARYGWNCIYFDAQNASELQFQSLPSIESGSAGMAPMVRRAIHEWMRPLICCAQCDALNSRCDCPSGPVPCGPTLLVLDEILNYDTAVLDMAHGLLQRVCAGEALHSTVGVVAMTNPPTEGYSTRPPTIPVRTRMVALDYSPTAESFAQYWESLEEDFSIIAEFAREYPACFDAQERPIGFEMDGLCTPRSLECAWVHARSLWSPCGDMPALISAQDNAAIASAMACGIGEHAAGLFMQFLIQKGGAGPTYKTLRNDAQSVATAIYALEPSCALDRVNAAQADCVRDAIQSFDFAKDLRAYARLVRTCKGQGDRVKGVILAAIAAALPAALGEQFATDCQ